jgi:predicted nucleic acid-binding protein
VILYADSSSLMKLYLDEAGSAAFRRSAQEAGGVASSIVAYAELRAGLARALRSARITERDYRRQVTALDHDWTLASKIDVDEPLVREAGGLAELHGLRGYDAIHLASALGLQRLLGEPVRFSAADGSLLKAAADAGLIV